MQQPSNPHNLPTDYDVVLLPTQPDALLAPRSGSHLPIQSPAQSAGRSAADRQAGIRTHAIRGVVVLEVAGLLGEVVEDLDRAIQLALAETPRGVVCDLSGVLEGAEPGAVEVLATAGRHVRDWSGIPVAVACPDPLVREALAAHNLGGQLIVTAAVFSAVSMVLVTPTPIVEWRRLAPHPTSPRASRDFVAQTLLAWGLDPLALSAGLVVSELVTSSMMSATTDIELSIAWNVRALRLTVRDNSPDLPCRPYARWTVRGPGPTAVGALSRASGVLPTADGGKVAWAVLNATRPRSLSSRRRPEPAAGPQKSRRLLDAPGPGKPSLCAV